MKIVEKRMGKKIYLRRRRGSFMMRMRFLQFICTQMNS